MNYRTIKFQDSKLKIAEMLRTLALTLIINFSFDRCKNDDTTPVTIFIVCRMNSVDKLINRNIKQVSLD
jgi:hypothetical protein